MLQVGAWAGQLPHAARRPRPSVRAVAACLSALILAVLARDLLDVATHWDQARGSLGADYGLYMDATRRWLAGGGFYLPAQVSGPYPVVAPAVMYPPTALLLFVPFTILPSVLWWAIPVAIVAWTIRRHRPQPVAWPVLALCLWFPTTSEVLFAGNPVMWVVAAVALGTVHGWTSVLVVLKPTVAPFALIGTTHRSWWVAAAALATAGLIFLPLWSDYVAVLQNARDPNGLWYSLNQVPTILLPIVAWIAADTGLESQRRQVAATDQPITTDPSPALGSTVAPIAGV